MSEPCVWSNLDFEYELAADADYRPHPQLTKLCERWQAILRVLPGCGDATLRPDPDKAFIPWGITPSVERLAKPNSFPPTELVKQINDKRFSHSLEVEFGCAFGSAHIVEDLDALDAAVESCSHDWVLKHPFGVGGRERVTGRQGCISKDAQSWARARFGKGWSLVFEPWAYQRQEFSFHYQIERGGKIEFLGQCGLVSDESGAFRGNRVLPRQASEESFLDITHKVANRLTQMGYWGPVSIDAFKGRLGASQVDRPIMEINARYSFGRLTLEMARFIPEGWCLHWWHPKARCRSEVEKTAGDYPEDLRDFRPGIYRLPPFADPARTTGSYLVVAPESAMLDEAVSVAVGSPDIRRTFLS